MKIDQTAASTEMTEAEVRRLRPAERPQADDGASNLMCEKPTRKPGHAVVVLATAVRRP